MSVTKQFLKSRPVCKVRFRVSPEEAGEAQAISVVGDFNGWDLQAHPMSRNKSGEFSLELSLPAGGTQCFRYRTDDGRWLTDIEADGLNYCAFAQADNSLLCLDPVG